jgi:hypothetical protein
LIVQVRVLTQVTSLVLKCLRDHLVRRALVETGVVCWTCRGV